MRKCGSYQLICGVRVLAVHAERACKHAIAQALADAINTHVDIWATAIYDGDALCIKTYSPGQVRSLLREISFEADEPGPRGGM